MALVVNMHDRFDIQDGTDGGGGAGDTAASLQMVQIIHGKPMAQVETIVQQPLIQLIEG